MLPVPRRSNTSHAAFGRIQRHRCGSALPSRSNATEASSSVMSIAERPSCSGIAIGVIGRGCLASSPAVACSLAISSRSFTGSSSGTRYLVASSVSDRMPIITFVRLRSCGVERATTSRNAAIAPALSPDSLSVQPRPILATNSSAESPGLRGTARWPWPDGLVPPKRPPARWPASRRTAESPG